MTKKELTFNYALIKDIADVAEFYAMETKDPQKIFMEKRRELFLRGNQIDNKTLLLLIAKKDSNIIGVMTFTDRENVICVHEIKTNTMEPTAEKKLHDEFSKMLNLYYIKQNSKTILGLGRNEKIDIDNILLNSKACNLTL